MLGLRKRDGERADRVEGDLKGEEEEGEVEVEVEGSEDFSFRSADKSSFFSQPTALVLRFS